MDASATPKAGLDWKLIVMLGAVTGLAMGASSSLGLTQDTPLVEFLLWVLWGALWVLVVARDGASRPFPTLVLVGLLTGVVYGATNQVLWSEYVANNTQSFTQPTVDAGEDPEGVKIRLTNFAISPVVGTVWGAVVGGLRAGVARLRGRRVLLS